MNKHWLVRSPGAKSDRSSPGMVSQFSSLDEAIGAATSRVESGATEELAIYECVKVESGATEELAIYECVKVVKVARMPAIVEDPLANKEPENEGQHCLAPDDDL